MPEKRADPDIDPSPLTWLDEDAYLVLQAGEVLAFDTGRRTLRPQGGSAPSWRQEPPNTSLAYRRPKSPGPVYVDKFADKVRLGHARQPSAMHVAGHSLRNQPFPFTTYLHFGKVGLLKFEPEGPVPTELPLRFPDNRSAPIVIWDQHAGQFFAYQPGCRLLKKDEPCLRTAWRLSPDLVVLETLPLPPRNIVQVDEDKLSCFSCGCSCYTREDAYAVDGKLYFHVSGRPFPYAQRGLYEVVSAENGATSWRQVVKGRIEPPLAFSPSGCKVAFHRVSYFGNALEERNLCASGR